MPVKGGSYQTSAPGLTNAKKPRSPVQMPGGVSGEGPFCSGIQFGDVDWKFGEMPSSNVLCGDGEERSISRSLKKFKKVGKKEWKGEKKTKFRTVNYLIFSAFKAPSHTKPGLLGGGGADDKKVLNSKPSDRGGADKEKSFKPSTRSRAGLLHSLRGDKGVKVVCTSLASGHQVANKLDACDTASDTISEVASSHPAYHLSSSLESADGNCHFKKN